jgi:8-hydroxy-5-deazaflavin:NADPH oxidoreductase
VDDRVCIVGATGALGFGLALRLGHAGVEVEIGSRDADRAAEAAERATDIVPDGVFSAAGNPVAVEGADIIVLAVPFASQATTLKSLKEQLRPGQLVVDTTVPLAAAIGGRATRVLGVWQGSAAQQVQELVPEGVGVVSALHTVSAAHLTELDHTLDEDVLVCGDVKDDKRRVAQLIEQIPGLRCVDAGRLESSRLTEQITALMIGINGRYKVSAGIKVTGLPAELWG